MIPTSPLKPLGFRLQTPTLIGCSLLKSFAFRRFCYLLSAEPAIMQSTWGIVKRLSRESFDGL